MPRNPIDGGTTYKLAGALNDLIGPAEAVPLLLGILDLVQADPERIGELHRVVDVLREDVKREGRVLCRLSRRS